MSLRPPRPPLFPYTTLFRSRLALGQRDLDRDLLDARDEDRENLARREVVLDEVLAGLDVRRVAFPHRVEAKPRRLLDHALVGEHRRDLRERHSGLDLDLDVAPAALVAIARIRVRARDE